jgi:dCMP deaminase
MKKELTEAYMRTAEIFAELSKAIRLHVGAIIVKDNRIISIGYNGTPSGWDNNCETKDWCSDPGFFDIEEIKNNWPYVGEKLDVHGRIRQIPYRLKTKPEVIHAEMNAIGKLASSNDSGQGSTMFITHAPCMECAKLIRTSGISKVYYRNSYRDTSGIDFLDKCNIPVEKLDQ